MISIFDLLFICLSKIRGPRVSPLCLSVHALDNGPTAGNIQLPTVFMLLPTLFMRLAGFCHAPSGSATLTSLNF